MKMENVNDRTYRLFLGDATVRGLSDVVFIVQPYNLDL